MTAYWFKHVFFPSSHFLQGLGSYDNDDNWLIYFCCCDWGTQEGNKNSPYCWLPLLPHIALQVPINARWWWNGIICNIGHCQLHWPSLQWSSQHEWCTEWHPSSNAERGRPLPVCPLFCPQLEPVCSRCDKEVRITAQLYGAHFPAGSVHQVFAKEIESLWKCVPGFHFVKWWVYSVSIIEYPPSYGMDCSLLCHQ